MAEFENETSIRDLCISRGPFDEAENRRIWDAHFRSGPRRALRRPLKKYGLNRFRVLDVGCEYGQALIHFGADSMGIEIHADAVRFARAIGLSVIRGDILTSGTLDRPPQGAFDAVWCYAVLEHVAAPHTALMAMRSRLRDRGLLFLGLPVMPAFRIFEPLAGLVSRLIHGRFMPMSYTSHDHINGFTRRTGRFLVERAGFEVIEQSTFVSASTAVNWAYNVFARPFVDVVVTVGRKIPGWNYHPNSTRRVTDTGWSFRPEYIDLTEPD